MGDTGTKDRIGRVHLLDREVDRLDDTESNLEIEDELMSLLPELREIVIVAGEHGEPVPVVCTRGDLPLDNARWQKAISGRPGLAAPRQLRFDQLPMTATWKIRRPELVQLLQGGGLDD
jgi:acyl-coenzyme A synthetase/AMP-(fatty) acid ligase